MALTSAFDGAAFSVSQAFTAKVPSLVSLFTRHDRVEIKFYGAFVLNRRVDLHAIDATARWRGDAGSSADRARSAASSPR